MREQVRDDGRIQLWGHWIKLEDVRRADWRLPQQSPEAKPLSEDDFLFTPTASCLTPSHPEYES